MNIHSLTYQQQVTGILAIESFTEDQAKAAAKEFLRGIIQDFGVDKAHEMMIDIIVMQAQVLGGIKRQISRAEVLKWVSP